MEKTNKEVYNLMETMEAIYKMGKLSEINKYNKCEFVKISDLYDKITDKKTRKILGLDDKEEGK